MLDFHDPLLPWCVTAAGGVIAAAFCLYAVMLGFDKPAIAVGGSMINLWIVAAFAGALSAFFTALSFIAHVHRAFRHRRHAVAHQRLTLAAPVHRRHELEEHSLAAGAAADRVLEVRAASGEVFEIPMRVVNYGILRDHLDNMVMLYGERAGELSREISPSGPSDTIDHARRSQSPRRSAST